MLEELFQFTPLELILAGTTTGLFCVLLLYWIVSYARPLRQARCQELIEQNQPPVSVIVYAKNESVNLRKHLPALLAQEYPEYEVIVVNDGSTDESDNVLKRFEQEYEHLYHTYIPEEAKYLSRKKLALTVGIKAAKHEVLLFTEANSKPLSSYWIASIAGKYKAQTEIVLGFCAYGDYKGFLHKYIAYDNLLTGLRMLSSTLFKRPFTANGKNLSYKKSLFFDRKGYSKSLGLHAGEDDLFINEVANEKNTEVVYMADSIAEMTKIEYFKVWKEMKISRAATQRFYKGGRMTFYRIEELFFFFFVIACIASVVIGLAGNWLLAVFAVLLYLLRYMTKAIVMYKSAKLLRQKPASILILFFELLSPLFDIYVRIYRVFRGKNDFTFHI